MNTGNCDECGKLNIEIKRNYFNHKYCANCYRINFTHQPCSSCKTLKRLPVFETAPICNKCIASKPCVRCGKKVKSIGSLTSSGPMCGSCNNVSNRIERNCEGCGESSLYCRKTQVNSVEVVLCNKCSTIQHRTCSMCRRHRKVYKTHNGKPCCKKCSIDGLVTCPLCNELHPAGYGERCEKCYFKEVFEGRVKLGLEGLESDVFKNYWVGFCDWLSKTRGYERSRLKVNFYVVLFQFFESNFSDIPKDYALTQALGGKLLKKYALFTKWFSEIGNYQVEDKDKTIDREQRLINEYLAFFSIDSNKRKITLNYYQSLLLRDIKVRSIRLALTPAVNLFKSIKNDNEPSQEELDTYLVRSPGQRASIIGYINFLNKNYLTNLNPRKVSITKTLKKDLEEKMFSLMANDSASDDEWITACLAYFHNIQNEKLIKKPFKYRKTFTEWVICWNGTEYPLPKRQAFK